jgi:tetratricopeptide (TPR) repeat protein
MGRSVFTLLLTSLLSTFVFAQTPAPQEAPAINPAVEFHRPGPPPKDATAVQLEATGDTLRDAKLYLDAIDYYHAAAAKTTDQENKALLFNKSGFAALFLGRFHQGRSEFERAVKANPKLAFAYNNIGATYYQERNFGKASKFFRKAIALDDDSASYHSNLGSSYFNQKKYEKANVEYARAMQLDPQVFERRSNAGITAHIASPEERAHFYYVVARMYAKQKNVDHALLYLRKAMEEGYSKIRDVYQDSEFASLRKDPRFEQLMTKKPLAISETQQQ